MDYQATLDDELRVQTGNAQPFPFIISATCIEKPFCLFEAFGGVFTFFWFRSRMPATARLKHNNTKAPKK